MIRQDTLTGITRFGDIIWFLSHFANPRRFGRADSLVITICSPRVEKPKFINYYDSASNNLKKESWE